jgi:hypothetical protein
MLTYLFAILACLDRLKLARVAGLMLVALDLLFGGLFLVLRQGDEGR